ncbi:hypothetical protein EBZ38_00310 [bacterium]|nr:hypothetical protein [bacterium]
MAIYINGIQDYIPQIQPFKPDFNFFQSALSTKQAQYEAGYNKINSIYGQLLNANLLRESNKERRDNLFTEIDSEINRLSGVDLSLAENVEQAGKLFQPLIDNQFFRKDLVFTKQYESEQAKGMNLRNNPNPKSDEKYWEEGMSALHYQASDFANSSDEDSMKFQAPRYVPFINAAENLFKFAKDNDINIVTPDIRGGFIFKYTNGQPAIPTIKNVFSSLLVGDPRIKDMFRTQSYLDRKNYIQSNLDKFNGDAVAAENDYLQSKIKTINEYYRVANMDDTERMDYAKSKKKVIEATIKEKGVDPNLDQDLIAIYQNTLQDEAVQQSVLDKNNEALTQTDFVSYDPADLEGMRQRVDGAMSYFLLDDLATSTATNYAMSHADIDIKEDPYTVLRVKHAYAMAEMEQQFGYDKAKIIMNVAAELMKNNGTTAAGTAMDEAFNSGWFYSIPGPGNVQNKDIDIFEKNRNVQSAIEGESSGITKQSMEEFLSVQNYYITNGTPEQKALATKAVKDVLGEYQVQEKTPEMIKEVDLPTDWETGLIGVAELVGGGLLTAISGVGEVFSAGTATPLAAAGIAAGLTGIYQGSKDISSGFGGTTTEKIPEQIKKTSGLAVRNSNGIYTIVDISKAPEFNIEGTGSYYATVQQKMADALAEQSKVMKDGRVNQALINIQGQTQQVKKNEQIKAGIADLMIKNNTKIASALALEAGVDAAAADVFFNKNKSGIKSENQFVQDYVSKLKTQRVGRMATQGASLGSAVRQEISQIPGLGWLSEGPESESEMIEEAQDAYDDLVEAYETLKKDPGSNLGLDTIDPKLAGNGGINRFFGMAAGYAFDAAAFNTTSFDMIKDFYVKDFMPKTASLSFFDDYGINIVSGISGFDLTAEDLQDEEIVNPDKQLKALTTLKAFLSSAMINSGGKTGENQMRPTGNYFLHALAANDGNKVAMTWEISPAWVKEHAGTEKAKGVAWDLQQNINEGKPATITFMMDADKAESSPFTAMQSTKDEMLMRANGKITLDSFKEMGGNLEIVPNAVGGFTYSGQARSVDAAGNILNQPVFGTTNTDINSTVSYFSQMFETFAKGNMEYINSLKESSANKIYDPAQLNPS